MILGGESETEKVIIRDCGTREAGILLKILYAEKTIAKGRIYGGHRWGPRGRYLCPSGKFTEGRKRGRQEVAAPEKRARASSGEVKAFPAAKMLAKQNGRSIWLKFREPDPRERVTKEDVRIRCREEGQVRERRIPELGRDPPSGRDSQSHCGWNVPEACGRRRMVHDHCGKWI